MATLVAHPQHGVSVRKMFDPAGAAYSPQIVARKAALGSLPGTAKLLGTAATKQNTPIHFNEYVPGTVPHADDPRLLAAQQQLQQAAGAKRYHMADIRRANAKVTPSGEVKFIDAMPLRPGDLAPDHAQITAKRPNMIPVHERAAKRLFGGAKETRAQTPAHLQSATDGEATRALWHQNPAAAKARMDMRDQQHNAAFKQYMLSGTTPAAPKPLPPIPPQAPPPGGAASNRPLPSAGTQAVSSGGLSSMFSSAPVSSGSGLFNSTPSVSPPHVSASQNPLVSAPTVAALNRSR